MRKCVSDEEYDLVAHNFLQTALLLLNWCHLQMVPTPHDPLLVAKLLVA